MLQLWVGLEIYDMTVMRRSKISLMLQLWVGLEVYDMTVMRRSKISLMFLLCIGLEISKSLKMPCCNSYEIPEISDV